MTLNENYTLKRKWSKLKQGTWVKNKIMIINPVHDILALIRAFAARTHKEMQMIGSGLS